MVLPAQGLAPGRRQGGLEEGVTLEYLVLDMYSCACRAEAHEQMARHCPLPIDRPRLGLL